MRAAAVGFLAAWAAAPAVAASSCDVQNVSFPFDIYDDAHRWIGTRDFEMVLSRDSCEVRRLVTPRFACDLQIGTSHGSSGFQCGSALQGAWRVRHAGDGRSYFDTIGDGRHAVVPSSGQLRKIYDHLDDDDAAKPIYKDDFPARFTFIGRRTSVNNPDLQASLQPLRYRTMAGEDRLAYSADAVVGCVTYQFGIILKPPRQGDAQAAAQDTERDLSTFLGDLRLEPVDDPTVKLRPLHTPLMKDALLAPILACYRRRDGEPAPR